MSTKPVSVKQDPENPVPVEVLAESIKAIAQGVRKLREGQLNDRCLFLLIQHAAPTDGRGRMLAIGDIKAVFAGIEGLEAEYLRKKKA